MSALDGWKDCEGSDAYIDQNHQMASVLKNKAFSTRECKSTSNEQ